MIDLHIHTSNSDGVYSTFDILKMSEEKNLNTISICDHNKLEAYYDLKKTNIKDYYSGKIIPGIEFDFTYKKKLFHMLGYSFDIDKLNMSEYIDRNTDEDNLKFEKEKFEYLKSVCIKLGIKLSDNLEVTNPNLPANDVIKIDMLSHIENNEILDKLLGKNREISFWRGHVTNPESPFYIDYTKGVPDVKIICDEIHRCNGIVVLPHVFEYKSINNIEFLNDMYNMNLIDGIECVHTKHTKEQTEFLKNFAKEKGLLISGGSDFHNKEDHILGYGDKGNLEITDEYCLKKVIDA